MPHDPHERLRRAIVEARKQRGWTQDDLARVTGLSRTGLSKLESGETDYPRSWTLQKIAQAFGWSDDDLVALMRGESPHEPVTAATLAVVRLQLPTAPREVLERYAVMAEEAERLDRELQQMRERYGPQPVPSSPRPAGESS